MRQFVTLPLVLVLAGGIIAAVGAFWTALRQAQERTISSVQRAKAEEDLRAKTEEIARLNKSLADLVTGGSSYCYLSVAISTERSCILTVVHEGEHPLYDVSARIVDLQKFQQITSRALDLKQIMSADTRLALGNLSPHQAMLLGDFELGSGNARDFNIFYSARNGFFTQLLRCRRIEGKWVFATRVLRDGVQQDILKEAIDPKFPRDSTGEVNW